MAMLAVRWHLPLLQQYPRFEGMDAFLTDFVLPALTGLNQKRVACSFLAIKDIGAAVCTYLKFILCFQSHHISKLLEQAAEEKRGRWRTVEREVSRKQPDFHFSSLAKSFVGLVVWNELLIHVEQQLCQSQCQRAEQCVPTAEAWTNGLLELLPDSGLERVTLAVGPQPGESLPVL